MLRQTLETLYWNEAIESEETAITNHNEREKIKYMLYVLEKRSIGCYIILGQETCPSWVVKGRLSL